MNFIASVLASSISVAAPLMYASVGEIISERSGVSNLGLEGIMLVGAVTGYLSALHSGSLLAGVLGAMLAGAVIGLFYALMTVTLQANQIVCGLALVTVGTGISGFLGKAAFGKIISHSFNRIAIPGLSQIPFLGPVLFEQNLLVYALYFVVPLAWFYLFKTRPGLKLRALGENPAALDAAGVSVYLLRYLYVTVGCAIVAVGGAYITLAYTPAWIEGITAGRGWIAAALVIFAVWNPLFAAAGAILFGSVEVLGLRLQVIGITIPSYFVRMLPYICTVVVLIFSTGSFKKRKASSMPASLGKHYDREER